MPKSLSKFLILFALSILFLSPAAHADFGGEFEEAENAAGKLQAKDNTGAVDATETLATAGTVKTVADWVGVTATVATIGTELYDWTIVDDDKLKELDAEYRAAIDAGNESRAEDVLREINTLNEKKAAVAKDQAGTQDSLATIQNVAGYANLGAATGSFVSAAMGYSAASDLRKGMKTDKDANVKGSKAAIKKAKSAANTALVYGAGEAAVGILSLHLAKRHKKRAESLESLADDLEGDLPTDVRMDIDALFDTAAVNKCGAGAEYRVLNTGGSVSDYDPDAPRVAGDSGNDDVLYSSVYNRIECITSTVADGGNGTTTTTGGTTTGTDTDDGGTIVSGTDLISCTSDVQACPDGSFVGRDANNNCSFFACPSATTTAANTTDGPNRELTSSGASRLQLDDVGAEIEQNQENILQNY